MAKAGKVAEKGTTYKVPVKENIAIVGFASSRSRAPYDDPSWEIWGVNELYMVEDVKRIDVLFELHDLSWIREGKRNPKHIEWLKKASIPIWMQAHYDEIPQSVPFPKDQLVERFGRYFTNTISWEIALAIVLGAKKIALYGVDMATDIEYTSQRPSVEYFVGLARGMGIEVYVPPESDLLKTPYLYGFEDGELSVFATKLKEYQAQQQGMAQTMQAQINAAVAKANQAAGASGTIDYILRAFVYPNGNFPKNEYGGSK